MNRFVFNSDEMKRIANLDGEHAEASQQIEPADDARIGLTVKQADRRFDVFVEVFERRGGRLHRRGASGT